MHELRRSGWKGRLLIIGILFFLLLVEVVLPTKANAQMLAITLSVPAVQPTPTVDATVTALNKEKLNQEVQQLKEQNDPSFFGWFRANASVFLSVLIVLIGGLVGLWRWFGDRRGEREKRAEERFQSAVVGLGDEREGAQIGAAILLRTFLRSGYEQFYTQTFDLAVANLRRREISKTVQYQLWDPPQNLDTVHPLTTLDQALIVVFKEAFPLARDQEKREPASLDATGIQLDNAYLVSANLKQFWGPQAFLRKANLTGANLRGANLRGADLSGADLSGADLRGADLRGANLGEANLDRANLTGADLRGANFHGANLCWANLTGADLSGANLGEANLIEADLSGTHFITANLSRANLSRTNLSGTDFTAANLTGANLSRTDRSRAKFTAADLRGANVRGVISVRAGYSAKSAFVDKELVSDIPEVPVLTSLPLASKNEQPDSAQQIIPIPDVNQSNNVSSQSSLNEKTSTEAEKGGSNSGGTS